ncbi:MAG: histidine kinase [Chloroflexi bacterium]|nr:MAG: histidine kinase [Chloroflexota bacterium]
MSLDFFDYRVRQRDYLLSIAQALVSRLNLRAVLRLILQGAVDLLQGQAGLIALRTEEGKFVFWASYGLPPALVASFEPLLENVPAVTNPADFSIPELGEKLGGIAEETGLLLRQVVALPMMVEPQPLKSGVSRRGGRREQGKELLGVIFVLRSHSLLFSLDDRQVLASFADYAAIAVNNARLYETAVTERRRLDALLDVSADGIMVLGPDLKVTRTNRALSTLTGWPEEKAIGQPYDALIVWARLNSERTLRQVLDAGWPTRIAGMNMPLWQGRPLYVEGELRRRNGSMVSVGITYAPLLARSGRLLNIIAIVRDITRFREAEALKDTFISIVSHELKTPVAIIKGYAETLSRPRAQRDPALMKEMLGAIVEESDRLASLVDDLLDASRLQAGGLPFQDVEEVDLSAVARHVVERYRLQAQNHDLVLDFPPDFPAVEGDPRRLDQVLDNLVSNAIKYSPQGGEVRIAGQATPAEVTISVRDSGIGVPLEEQERIFERFYRVESPETRAVSGTGLGLYLTRAIVRAHGGRIWVESAPGRGAIFYVVLPRQTGLALWEQNSNQES